MKIRLATLNTPLFDHEGLKLTEKWTEVDASKLTPAGRAAIVKYRGHIVNVHSADEKTYSQIVETVNKEKAAAAKRGPA
jgi:hypothetical protein